MGCGFDSIQLLVKGNDHKHRLFLCFHDSIRQSGLNKFNKSIFQELFLG